MTPRILIAPLDWGLGHATRCIPIVRALLERRCHVHLAGSGASLAMLRQEFPALPWHELPAYNPTYPRRRGMVWKMARQLPHFVSVIRREHQVLEQLVRDNAIGAVIADNRYGCWSAHVPSVFVTHQSNILMPRRFGWLAPAVRRVNERMMKRFTRCWIPDSVGEHSLAGDLISFGGIDHRIEVEHIGALSRFTPPVPRPVTHDVVCICSGPEPQRSVFEQLLVQQLLHSGLRYFIVRGLPQNDTAPALPVPAENYINFLAGEALQQKIEAAYCIVARSGYSTVMDLATLGKRAIFVPTPGQTEQEYLAQQCMKRNIALAMPQHGFDLQHGWQALPRYTGFAPLAPSHHALAKAIDRLLSDIAPAQKEVS